ncbi:epoxide hydrolase [Dendrothele bispora CBS 962.96]|uniref:Epoxide hydrolase n=1 Tax=Dendrothele bispora (strain CBS 962.96) TaxID=1314807 RepID=A0A4S8MYJ0_DENBC|nr:epoxide hydrolase [Dendrothele bispora CBS 962.96]
MDPASFNHRVAQLSTGRTYHFVDQLPENYKPRRTPTLLCVHGFPDCWYQIGPWTRKGFRVVVPNMLGYGDTDRPQHPSEYSTKKLCADLAALLDFVGVQRAVVIGHDWGAFTAGRFALWHPDRLHALVILSVPYTPPTPQYMPVEKVAKLAPDLAYQAYFASAQSSKDLDAHLLQFLRMSFQKPHSTKSFSPNQLLSGPEEILTKLKIQDSDIILGPKELAYYQQVLQKGMNEPLNYYRTARYRYEEERDASLPSKLREDLPVLFLYGTRDTTCTNAVISKSHKFISRLQTIALEGRGHWVMVEAKDEVTEMIAAWLEELMTRPPKPAL